MGVGEHPDGFLHQLVRAEPQTWVYQVMGSNSGWWSTAINPYAFVPRDDVTVRTTRATLNPGGAGGEVKRAREEREQGRVFTGKGENQGMKGERGSYCGKVKDEGESGRVLT